MKVTTRISTGKLIEAQSGEADLAVMIQNAVNGGIPANDIAANSVTRAEFLTLLEASNPPPDPRIVLDEEEAAAVKADNQVQAFLNLSPAELDAWVDSNITGAGNAPARTAFKVLGRIALAAGRGRRLR